MANAYTCYDILGVGINATEQEIKIAFREQMERYYPDFICTQEAEDKLREITKAYDILSDVKKRKAYDNDLKRNHKVNFDEQLHDLKSNPYTSYSKKRTETDFENWIWIYLKSVRSMNDMKNFNGNGYIYLLKHALNITKVKPQLPTGDYIDYYDKIYHSQPQHTPKKRTNIKRKGFKR